MSRRRSLETISTPRHTYCVSAHPGALYRSTSGVCRLGSDIIPGRRVEESWSNIYITYKCSTPVQLYSSVAPHLLPSRGPRGPQHTLIHPHTHTLNPSQNTQQTGLTHHHSYPKYHWHTVAKVPPSPTNIYHCISESQSSYYPRRLTESLANGGVQDIVAPNKHNILIAWKCEQRRHGEADHWLRSRTSIPHLLFARAGEIGLLSFESKKEKHIQRRGMLVSWQYDDSQLLFRPRLAEKRTAVCIHSWCSL